MAATVLSINHVNSLKVESETAAPGEKPQFLGVREQRVTHILIFLTIGFSVMLTPLLSHIPMPVLFGVFLYMGAASLKGLQFFDRLLIMFMPVKYQPDFMFLRQVRYSAVQKFSLTLIFSSHTGANTSRTSVYRHSACLSHCTVAHQIIFIHINSVSIDVGRHDWHPQVVGFHFYPT